MRYTRILPSYIVPTRKIVLNGITIKPGKPVTVNDDWQREHWTGSVIVEHEQNINLVEDWGYFHALLADSRLNIYALQAKGEEPSSFQVEEFNNHGNEKIRPREINFDSNDVLPAVYLEEEDVPVISYKALYKSFNQKNEIFRSAVKNYFLAQDINFHNRLRYMDTSYWQIVIFVSALEGLLPPPTFCKGMCELCGKGVVHNKSDVEAEWNRLLFKRIKNKTVRKQYREVLNEARWRIRNDTVHNGLAPENVFWKSPALSDGVTEYTTEKSLTSYKTDRYSLESFIDQLKQVCRYLLLNQFIERDVFPDLKGIKVHSFSATSTESSFTMNIEIN